MVACLFLDVVGSTELMLRLGPDRMKDRLDRILARGREIAAFHGGLVEKYLGDGVLLVFGLETARIDDPERALRTAIECLEAVNRPSADGVQFSIRIGVEVGEVITEIASGEKQQEHLLVGASVNVAARLNQAAEPGQILVGPACYEATSKIGEFEALGPLGLKGLGEVPAWRLLRIREDRPAVQLPFVGRSTELGQIRRAYRGAIGGRGGIFLVVGPPGQGKSRLVEEFAKEVQPEARVLRAHCRPGDEAGSQFPLRQVLSEDVPEPTPARVDTRLGQILENPAERERTAEALTHSAGLGVVPRLVSLPAATRETEIARGWGFYLQSLARERPLVLWFEDLQWAEPNVQRLLGHISEIKGSRLFLVATARPEITGSASLRAVPEQSQCDLIPLDPESSSALARSVGSTVVADVVRAGGNPLFIIELASSPQVGGQLPVTVLGAIGARLDELPRADREVLQQVAVVGESFSVRDAALVTNRAPADVAGALARLVHLRYLKTDAGQFRFHHALVRDVAYGRLSASDRLRLHARFARDGVNPDDVETLAHHWWEALGQGDSEWVWRDDPELAALRHDALTATLSSAKRHSERASFERATDLCSRAIELSREPEEGMGAHEILANICSARGDGDGAWAEWQRALEAFKSVGRTPPARLYAEMVRNPVFNWSTLRTLPDKGLVLDLFDEGIRAAKDSGDPIAQARLLAQRAIFTGEVTDLPLAAQLLDTAPNESPLADALQALGTAWFRVGEISRAETAFRRLDELLAKGVTINEGESLIWRVLCTFVAGDIEAAGQLSRRLCTIAEKGHIHLKSHAMGTEALVHSGRGDWSRVATVASETKQIVNDNPHIGFCLLGASAVAWGVVGDVLAGGSIEPSLPILVERILPDSAPLRASSLLLPEALEGGDAHYTSALAAYDPAAGLWDREIWDHFGVRLLVALTVLQRWDELRIPLEHCESTAQKGGRMLGAVAAAVREEMAAVSGGPRPIHSALRQLGYSGLSEVLSYRPRHQS